jgi:hypothetical protein
MQNRELLYFSEKLKMPLKYQVSKYVSNCVIIILWRLMSLLTAGL